MVPVVMAIAAVLLIASGHSAARAEPSDDPLAPQVQRLVQQLDDDQADRRRAAERALIELGLAGVPQAERLLALLPVANDRMPPAVRDRLKRIRQQVEEHLARSATSATTVTLKADRMPLADVLAAIEAQTGNRLIDNRAEFGGQAVDQPLTFDFDNEPFWSAVDQILDQAGLAIYNYSGEPALAIIAREEGDGPRFGRAAYSGPFRFEVLEVQAQRSLRKPGQQSLKLRLEIGWEPRLRPIALSQPMANLDATLDSGELLDAGTDRPVLDVEVQGGNQATEFVLPFELPPREADKIATLKGTINALVPGRQAKFRFDNLDRAAGSTDQQGGVEVVLDGVRKNNQIWEVHMRLRIDDAAGALESHRGWVFHNPSYLVSSDGQPIDNVGYETTLQGQNEVGMAYLFDLDAGIEGLAWVYESPAAIVELPVDFELKDIRLP